MVETLKHDILVKVSTSLNFLRGENVTNALPIIIQEERNLLIANKSSLVANKDTPICSDKTRFVKNVSMNRKIYLRKISLLRLW